MKIKFPLFVLLVALVNITNCHIASSTSVYGEPLELNYYDVWGPSPMSSSSGARYYITFMDAFSKLTWFYLLNHESQALSTFI